MSSFVLKTTFMKRASAERAHIHKLFTPTHTNGCLVIQLASFPSDTKWRLWRSSVGHFGDEAKKTAERLTRANDTSIYGNVSDISPLFLLLPSRVKWPTWIYTFRWISGAFLWEMIQWSIQKTEQKTLCVCEKHEVIPGWTLFGALLYKH